MKKNILSKKKKDTYNPPLTDFEKRNQKLNSILSNNNKKSNMVRRYGQ